MMRVLSQWQICSRANVLLVVIVNAKHCCKAESLYGKALCRARVVYHSNEHPLRQIGL